MTLQHFDCCCHFSLLPVPHTSDANMSSGVQVADDVRLLFLEMKVNKTTDDGSQRLRFVKFKIDDGFIKVEKKIQEQDLAGETDHFQHFKNQLCKDECCYVLYDCHYENNESSKKEDLLFFMWTPDGTKIKDKMCYASSKDALTKVFTGAKDIKQINDPEDFNLEYFADMLGKHPVTIEGCCVKRSHKKGH